MVSSLRECETIILQLPHIRTATVQQDAEGQIKVRVLTDSGEAPRHTVREILSVLRNYGWSEIRADAVTVVQVQSDGEDGPGPGRPKIAGFALGYGPAGVQATCRLTWQARAYEGRGIGATRPIAVAQATLAAVNEVLAQFSHLLLNSVDVVAGNGADVVVMTVVDSGELLAGCAIVRETLEESVMRAALDAVNRRFHLYTGQKH